MSKPENSYDRSYKKLFSHPAMMQSLLEDWVGGAWLAEVDFSTLTLCGTEHISDDFRSRYNDMIWKVQFRGQDLYLFLMLEFQNRPDNWMAMRTAVYTGMLYQDLIAGGVMKPGDALPPVLPIVLYNGERPWQAPVSTEDLIAPVSDELDDYILRHKYFLIEERKLSNAAKEKAESLTARIFQLEEFADIEEIKEVTEHLFRLLAALHDDSLTATMLHWIHYAVVSRFDAEEQEIIIDSTNPKEMQAMLEKSIERAREKLRDEGKIMGIQQGKIDFFESLIRQKFGIGCMSIFQQRVKNASSEELDRWGLRILTAQNIEEVFDS